MRRSWTFQACNRIHIDSTARAMAQEFFDRFVRLMSPHAEPAAKKPPKKGLKAAVKKLAGKFKRG